MAKKIIKNEDAQTATRIFTDRVEPRQAFWKKYNKLESNIQNIEDIYIIAYYGIGGIGKSALLKKLSEEMEEKGVQNTLFDFETSQEPQKIMYLIKNKLERKYEFNFPKFDLAIYTYAIKIGQDANKPEVKSIIEQSRTLSLITEAIGELPTIGLFSKLVKYADSGIAILKTYTDKSYKQFLEELENKTEAEILEELPKYFSQDLTQNITKTNKPLVILLDTYEKMINEISNDGYVLMKDMWLRGDNGIILRTPGVLWVIAGREKLKWGENDKDWEETIEQHRLGDLAFSDADEFLQKAGIVENKLREQIYKLTNGTPVYLDLCVSTYEDLKRKNEQITIDKFGETKEELVERYVRYMDNQTREIVYMLAQLGNWNDNIIYEIGKEVVPTFSIEKYETIKQMSFIYENNGEYYIHKTIENVLKRKCPRIIIKKDSEILSKYLKEKIIKEKEQNKYSLEVYGYRRKLYTVISNLVEENNIEQITKQMEEIESIIANPPITVKEEIKHTLYKNKYGEKDERTLRAKLDLIRYLKGLKLRTEANKLAIYTYQTSLEKYGEESDLTIDAKLWYLMTVSDIVEYESDSGEYEYVEEKHKKYLDMAKETYQQCLNKFGRNNKRTIKALYMWLLFEPDDDTFFNITMEIYKSCKDTLGETNRFKIEKILNTENHWYIPFKECERKLQEEI